MRRRARHARTYRSLALFGAVAGVLIWAKLRLSTDMPRTAIADPKQQGAENADAPAPSTPADRPEALPEAGDVPAHSDGR